MTNDSSTTSLHCMGIIVVIIVTSDNLMYYYLFSLLPLSVGSNAVWNLFYGDLSLVRDVWHFYETLQKTVDISSNVIDISCIVSTAI